MGVEVGSGGGVTHYDLVEIHVSQVKEHKLVGPNLRISFSGCDSAEMMDHWIATATKEDPVQVRVLSIVPRVGSGGPLILMKARVLRAHQDALRWELDIVFDEPTSNTTTLKGRPQVKRPQDGSQGPDRVRLNIPGALYRRLGNAGHSNVNELTIRLLEEFLEREAPGMSPRAAKAGPVPTSALKADEAVLGRILRDRG